MMNTKERILSVAALEFSKSGYKGTTIRTICKKANVNVASVNYHFKGKLTLYKNVVEYLFKDTELDLEFHPVYRDHNEWKEGLFQWILDFFRKVTDSSPHKVCLHKIFFREMLDPSGLFPVFYQDYFQPTFQNLKKIISYGSTSETTEEETYIAIFSILGQCIFYEQNKILISHVFGCENFIDERIKAENIVSSITEEIYALTLKKG